VRADTRSPLHRHVTSFAARLSTTGEWAGTPRTAKKKSCLPRPVPCARDLGT